jgi:hypothetical protein
MKNAKPMLALASVMAGAMAAGVAMYIQENPLAFTTPDLDAAAPTRAPELTINMLPPERAVEFAESEPAAMPAWMFVEPAPAKPKSSPPLPKETTVTPCSEWFTMAQGPIGRQVRMLCVVPADAPIPNS